MKLVQCELKWLIIVLNDAFCIQATQYIQFFFKLIYFKRAVLLRLKRSDIHMNTHTHTQTPTYNKYQ